MIWDQCTTAEIAAVGRSRVVILPLAPIVTNLNKA